MLHCLDPTAVHHMVLTFRGAYRNLYFQGPSLVSSFFRDIQRLASLLPESACQGVITDFGGPFHVSVTLTGEP